MQIALFGGGFDPPHVGHQFITTTLLERKLADQVWYVPVKEHPFGKKLSSGSQRLEMLKLILPAHNDRVRIETYELEKEGMSYTFETLEFLSHTYPQDTFSWVIGSDNLPTFNKWTDIHPGLLKYPFWVYPRQGFPLQPLFPNMKPLHDVQEVAVSSTEVRNLVQAGKPITGLVDPEVAGYIKTHHLYAA